MRYLIITLFLFSCESLIKVELSEENSQSDNTLAETIPDPITFSSSKSQLVGNDSITLDVTGGIPNYTYSAPAGTGISFSGNSMNYDGSYIGDVEITVTDNTSSTENISLSLMGSPEVWINSEDLAQTLSTNDPITIWPDRSNQTSGNTYDFQATGVGEEPILINDGSGLAGLPYARFDGTKCMLSQDSFPATNEFEVFVVYRDDGIIQSWEKVFGYRHSNGFTISRVGSSSDQIMMAINQVIDGAGQGNLSSLSLSDGDWLILHGRRETDNTRWIEINGMALIGNTIQNTSATSNSQIGVGCHSGAGERMGGDIMEVITYRDQLTPAERQYILDYLSNKYGL